LPETLIEGDHFQRRWTPFGREVGGGELQRVARAKGMDAEQSPRDFSKFVVEFDLEPGACEEIEAMECFRSLGRGQRRFALPIQVSSSFVRALMRGSPPSRARPPEMP
jgi:hypothetical protein